MRCSALQQIELLQLGQDKEPTQLESAGKNRILALAYIVGRDLWERTMALSDRGPLHLLDTFPYCATVKECPSNSMQEVYVKSYTFKVVLEKDKWLDEPDEKAVWRAYVPALEQRGAHAWGDTQEQALENLRNALELLIEYLKEQGEPIPEGPRSQIRVSKDPLLTVNV